MIQEKFNIIKMSKKNYLILIIIGIVSIAGYLFYNQNGATPNKLEKACLESGGEVITANCCASTEDFPNQCTIGACGCAPQDSHEVKVCDCGGGKCFNGEECVKRDSSSKNSFEEEGYLVKYGQEEKWALNYEEPGKPALVVTLEFDEESKCNLAQGNKPCLEFESYGEVGNRVKVIGVKKEGTVLVDELIYIK
ncbi:MAG: hypothetical protein V5A57_00135 [Candidatus Paceibacterota bacterium]